MTLTHEKLILHFINATECVEKVLSCAICLETSLDPVETRCGHLFCHTCIQQTLNRPGESCPLCKLVLTRRNVLSGAHIRLCVKQLSNLIEAIRKDCDIDVKDFLRMHSKKRSFLVSSSLSNKITNSQIQNEKGNKYNDDQINVNNKTNQRKQKEAIDVQPSNFHKTSCSVQRVNDAQEKMRCTMSELVNRKQCIESKLEMCKKNDESVWINASPKYNTATVKERLEKRIVSEITNVKMNISKSLSFDKKRKVSNESMNTNSPKLQRLDISDNIRTGCDHSNKAQYTDHSNTNALNFGKPQPKQIQSVNTGHKLVPFNKLGNLTSTHKKNVKFLYFGVTKKQDSKVSSCNGLADRSTVVSHPDQPNKIQSEFSLLHKLKSKSFDDAKHSTSLHPLQTSTKQVCNTKKLTESVDTNKQISRVEQKRECLQNESILKNPCHSKVQKISRRSYPGCSPLSTKSGHSFPMSLSSFPVFHESRKIHSERPRSLLVSAQCKENVSLKEWESALSSRISRKRKRSTDEFPFKGHSGKTQAGLNTEQIRNGTGKTYRRNCSIEAVKPLQITVSKPVEGTQEFPVQDLNSRICVNVTNKPFQSVSKNTQHFYETQDHRCIGVPNGEECSPRSTTQSSTRIQPTIKTKRSTNKKSDKCSEMIPSNDSLMDITGEELLLKKFENDLFCETESECPQQPDRSAGNQDLFDKENTRDSFQLMDYTIPQNQRHYKTLMNEPILANREPVSKNTNIVDPTTPPSVFNVANCSESSQVIEKAYGLSKYVQRSSGSSGVKPLYQSTPKSSYRMPVDHPNPKVCREIPNRSNSLKGHANTEGISNSMQLERSMRHLCILCSGLTSKEIAEVKCFTSVFTTKYVDKFSSDVTHVIIKTDDNNNAAYRTLKYLQGIAYRKWVVNINWILNSLAQKKLLDEETYEVVDSMTLITGPKNARLGKRGPFENFVVLCIEPFTNISQPDYEDLLRRTGAKVVGTLDELAAEKNQLKVLVVEAEYHDDKIIEWHQKTGAVPVAHEWIIECISQYRLVSLLPFLQELLPHDVLDLGFPAEIVQDNDTDFMYEL